MYLSRLEILGFKSFAQKVDMRFDDGITAIVGPNGCGKTNIVDAIRWVLGEQKTTMLRSTRMEDVIFNGTKTRKPLGFAETSLTIENTKGILPLEYSEITITRRMYRSGESEYLLNKTQCRLKDILNLFMDTGMGANAYSVIELKMVETILSDRTDERRRLFEEAAGITKFKHNRKIAHRKLEDVQNDLQRVNDIIKEVQTTVNSLHRQAKKAERYNEYHLLLKQLERELLEREYYSAVAELHPLDTQLSQQRSDKYLIDTTLLEKERLLEQYRTDARGKEQDAQNARNIVHSLQEEVRTLDERNLILTERTSALKTTIHRYGDEQKLLADQKNNFEEQKKLIEQRRAECVSKISEVRVLSSRFDATLAESLERETQAKIKVQLASDEVIEILRSVSSKENEVQKRITQQDAINEQLRRIDTEIEHAAQTITSLETAFRELTKNDKELRRRFAEAELSYFEKENTRATLQTELELAQRSILDIDAQLHQKSGKIDFLKGLIERNEGFSEGAKYLLSDEKRKTGLLPVADIIRTSNEYRIAVETVLGEAREYLLARTSVEAEEAISVLSREQKGKVTFICLDRVSIPVENIFSHPQNMMNMIDGEEMYRPVLRQLFGDVIVVENISESAHIFQEYPGVRCVSKDGQMINDKGLRRGGSMRQGEGIFIGRHSHIEELTSEIEILKRQKTENESRKTLVEEQLQSFDIKAMQHFVKDIEREMTQLETRLAQIAFEKKHREDALAKHRAEFDILKKELQEVTEGQQRVTEEFGILLSKKSQKDIQLVGAREHLSLMEDERHQKAEEAKAAHLNLITLEGEERTIETEFKHTEQLLDDNTRAYQRAEIGILESNTESALLSREFDQNAHRLNDVRKKMESAEQRSLQLEESYQSVRTTIDEFEASLKEQRRLHELSTTTVHELELSVTEITSRVERLKERARTEFKFEFPEQPTMDEQPVPLEERRNEIDELRGKIDSLGGVNFEAFEQYSVEKERLDFLTKQRDDLLAAERDLNNTIVEINTTAKEKFQTTFYKIRENFITIFKTLFDEGDECDLRLEEGDNVDPLDCGIEIIAKPRGKRPTSIDLLSGGEKTLTATALLFAIYLVKPSPFCVLDEVDAPLDDLNIDRFVRLLNRFSDNTQFIVVTHNKRTMEAAKALYGVTMEEEGISKIVSVKFNGGATVRSVSVATE